MLAKITMKQYGAIKISWKKLRMPILERNGNVEVFCTLLHCWLEVGAMGRGLFKAWPPNEEVSCKYLISGQQRACYVLYPLQGLMLWRLNSHVKELAEVRHMLIVHSCIVLSIP